MDIEKVKIDMFLYRHIDYTFLRTGVNVWKELIMQNSNTDWITTKELAEIKGISERAVRKSIAKNKYVIRKSSKSYEILVTSLEENVRKKVTESQEKSTAPVPIIIIFS